MYTRSEDLYESQKYTRSEYLPCHKIIVTEYQCAKCSYRWINWHNGREGPKPNRCSRCKKWDWDEGRLSPIEKQLRRDLLKIEENEIKYSTIDGTGLYPIPTDICTRFLGIFQRPTEEELRIVLNPMCYLGPYDHSRSPLSHKGTCSDQVDPICGPGWIPMPDKGCYDFDDKIYQQMERKEKYVRHELMQHIIDSREGIMNTNSTHYRYFENKKRLAKSLNESDPREMFASAMMGKPVSEDELSG